LETQTRNNNYNVTWRILRATMFLLFILLLVKFSDGWCYRCATGT